MSSSARAHPAHETNAEMVWNQRTQSLEVALRMRGIDLEAALTPPGAKRIDLESTKGIDAKITDYLNRSLTVRAPDGTPSRLRFIGKTVTAREVWLYFQFPLNTESPFGSSLSNRLLFETLENQKNKVAFRAGRVRDALTFDKQQPTRTLVRPELPASSDWTPPVSLESLPSVPELPDVFTMAEGSRVATVEQWQARREEIKQIIQYFAYGHLPPAPDRVDVGNIDCAEVAGHPNAQWERMQLLIGAKVPVPLDVSIHVPESDSRRPVIVMPVHQIQELHCIPMWLNAGYAVVQYEREDLDPDAADIVGPAQAAYPDADWGTLAVWAWGAMRVVDYLETRDDMDLERIIITGHSRDGKVALLAGALDERFAIVAPNGSGCGGAGCFRNTPSNAESLEQITDPRRFGYWFHPRLRWFAGREDRLPFDQHYVKALVAPRALLCTEARGDLWANPTGTRRTSLAARDVYAFLSKADKLGLNYRDGEHDQTEEDWRALFDFAQWQLFRTPPGKDAPLLQAP